MAIKSLRTVLILSTSLSGGGAETVARLMVESIRGSRTLLFENSAGIVIAERNICAMGRGGAYGLIGKCLANIWRVIVIQYTKIRVQPQVTISHLEGPNFANLLTKWGGRRLIFVHNRVSLNYQRDGLADRIKKLLVKLLYRRADFIFCVSSDICAELVDEFGVPADRADVMPNPIDIKSIVTNADRPYGDIRDEVCKQRYLISVASLTTQKNHELLLKVFYELDRSPSIVPNLKLVLVGEGTERSRLQDLCLDLDLHMTSFDSDKFDLSAKIFFMGFQPNPYPLVREAELFVMPSFWEGLPIALLEAMALGVPSIVSNCSAGVRDTFDLSIVDLHQFKREGFIRTPYGVLVKQSETKVRSSAVSLWADLIRMTVSDKDYLHQCRVETVKRVTKNDLSNVRIFWEQTFSVDDTSAITEL